MGFAVIDRSFVATWPENTGSAAAAAKPRRRMGDRTKDEWRRTVAVRVVAEDAEMVGIRERDEGDGADAIDGGLSCRDSGVSEG